MFESITVDLGGRGMSTVRIRFKVSVCTTLGSYVPGEVADWDAVDAMRLIKAGYAELA